MIRTAKETDFDSVKNITQTTIWSVYPKYYPSGAVQFFSDHHTNFGRKGHPSRSFKATVTLK